MKGETLSGLLLSVAVALVAGVLLAVWLIGADRLFILAAVFIGALALAGVLASVALLVRAWRKRDGVPIEKHVYHDGTKTVVRERVIDARPALPMLPAPMQTPFGVFPEMLRASYRAGLLTGQDGRGDAVDAEVRELEPGDGWTGDITP